MLVPRLRAVFAAALCAGSAPPGRAEECGPLKIVASVDLPPADNAVIVPVKLQGVQKYMLLDTGGPFSELTPRTVGELKLEQHRTELRVYDVSGRYYDHVAVVPSFAIGTLSGSNVEFVVGPEFGNDDRLAGVLAANILRFYDVEIDFGAGKLTLLSQDHCEGKVIHWPADTLAVVPMRVAKSGHVIVPVALDGHTFQALLDTGASESVLNLSAAKDEFKLSDKNPDMTPVRRMHDRNGSVAYRHTFKSLEFEGIAVANPALDIVPDLVGGQIQQPPPTGSRFTGADEAERLPDLLIGMNVLHHLHIYIAYKEQKLYITPASTPGRATDGAEGRRSAASPPPRAVPAPR